MLLHECCDNHAMNMIISLMPHECGYIHVTALMVMEMDMSMNVERMYCRKYIKVIKYI